jgi:hypothetical protein
MCPACLATATWITGSAVSGGSLTAFIVKKFRAATASKEAASKTTASNKIGTQNQLEENYHGYQQHRNPAAESRSSNRMA